MVTRNKRTHTLIKMWTFHVVTVYCLSIYEGLHSRIFCNWKSRYFIRIVPICGTFDVSKICLQQNLRTVPRKDARRWPIVTWLTLSDFLTQSGLSYLRKIECLSFNTVTRAVSAQKSYIGKSGMLKFPDRESTESPNCNEFSCQKLGGGTVQQQVHHPTSEGLEAETDRCAYSRTAIHIPWQWYSFIVYHVLWATQGCKFRAPN
jgi:hypothetical protein